MKTNSNKSCPLNSIRIMLTLWISLLSGTYISAQQQFIVELTNGLNQQVSLANLKLTFDNNGVFSCWQNGLKQDINFTSVRKIYFKTNSIPIANAGFDQSINEGETVYLDGSASTDPDDDPLTYKWNAPVGITLSSTTAAKPNFIAPEVQKDSVLKFSLVVNDGSVDSNPSTVNISILNIIKVGNKEISKALFKVYPNPSTGIIIIEFNQNSEKKTEIFVSNLIGTEVFRKKLSNTNNYQVNLSKQASGIYILKLITNNQQYINKIIIQKQ